MTVTKPRVFIADFELAGYSGHSFNQVFGFCEAARARGLKTHVFVPNSIDPKIAAELNAEALLPQMHSHVSKNAILDVFPDARRILRQLWEYLGGVRISQQDILVITSSRPQTIFGVGQWLASMPGEMRPAVFFRFFRTDFFNFQTKTFSETAWAHHFAARMLAAMPGGDRVFLTVNNVRAVRHLDRLTLRSTFFLPVPKYYGAIVDRLDARLNERVKIYVHVNRPSGMPELVGKAVNAIIQRQGDVDFVIRFCGYAFPTIASQETAARNFSGRNVTFLPGDQGPVEYLAAIEQADMVLLPYDPVEYHDIVSGIFCEAAAMGKVVIIPAGTWMGDHVLEARATGTLFNRDSVSDIVAAIERALQDRERLQAEALNRAGPFREENSCAANLDRMIGLAGQAHDMRLPYVPLTDTTTALGSQHYFGGGWSIVDEGFGIWSDGDRAEINFSIKPNAKALFFSAQVRPFLARSHSRVDVSLRANNVPVAEWSFDAARPGDLEWSWRHVRIPEELTARGDIQIVLNIRSPASPKDLGLSIDSRKLGIALRKLSLMPEMQVPDADPAETPSTLVRLCGRIKRTLKLALSSPE